jgi:hypothetical protein
VRKENVPQPWHRSRDLQEKGRKSVSRVEEGKGWRRASKGAGGEEEEKGRTEEERHAHPLLTRPVDSAMNSTLERSVCARNKEVRKGEHAKWGRKRRRRTGDPLHHISQVDHDRSRLRRCQNPVSRRVQDLKSLDVAVLSEEGEAFVVAALRSGGLAGWE